MRLVKLQTEAAGDEGRYLVDVTLQHSKDEDIGLAFCGELASVAQSLGAELEQYRFWRVPNGQATGMHFHAVLVVPSCRLLGKLTQWLTVVVCDSTYVVTSKPRATSPLDATGSNEAQQS